MGAERRLVTVLFADLVGSTEIGIRTDPELLRDQLTHWFDRMSDIAEVFGGTVEKFGGDAVTVFFGVPRIHDDDSERAVRSGLAMQDSMPDLNGALGTHFSIRIGINTGEAVVKYGDDGQFIVGDPVNIAQRLQQDAEPGEVVVGLLTEQLTRSAIDYELRGPAPAKGQPVPLKAYRAVRPKSTTPQGLGKTAPIRAPLVGRQRELRFLSDTFSRVAEDRQAHILLLLGPAGIGKSRLIEEGLRTIDASANAHVLQGRCLPYGRGITYWPLVEVIHQDAGIGFNDDRESAIAKLRSRIRAIGISGEQEHSVNGGVAALIGLSEASSPSPADDRFQTETASALRRYISAVASEQVVVIVIDDLQWAEPSILDLLEDITVRTANTAILWICIARPEFDEKHPHWAAARPNASRITLNPLTPAETSTLTATLLETSSAPAALLENLVRRSEGNPLFCEEFLRMILETDPVSTARVLAGHASALMPVPASIQALLATRLDALRSDEKLVLQKASVIGERFTPTQVKAISGIAESVVDGALDRLLIKGLVFEDSSAGDAALRFKHLLLRDAAYSALPKAERAELHHQFATHLESAHMDRVAELAQLISYHASKALELGLEMHMNDERIRPYAEGALKWNLWLAERSALREDIPVPSEYIAACNAVLNVLPADVYEAERLRAALLEAERFRSVGEYAKGRAIADQVRERAEAVERRDLAAAALFSAARIEIRRNPVEFRRLATQAGRIFKRLGNLLGDLDCEWLLAFDAMASGGGEPAVRHTAEIIDRAIALSQVARAALWMGITAQFLVAAGLPDEARAMFDRSIALSREVGATPEKGVVLGLAKLDSLAGQYEAAVDRVKSALNDEDWERFPMLAACRNLGQTFLRAHRFEEAATYLDLGARLSEEIGDRMSRSELCARRALAAIYQGQLGIGAIFVQKARDTAMADDPSALLESGWAHAELRWVEGETNRAEELFREAFEALTNYYDDVVVEVSLRFARLLIELDRPIEATALLDRADVWITTAGYVYGRAEIADLRRLAGSQATSPSAR
jgi:class 3 adenylate cyclase/tetratricopeptide (TPR) repeat protein